MKRTGFAKTRSTIRLAGALFAVTMTLAVVSVLTEQLHVERFGEGLPLVQLDRVTVTAERPAGERAFAAAPAAWRSN
jgi:hypothetical protein